MVQDESANNTGKPFPQLINQTKHQLTPLCLVWDPTANQQPIENDLDPRIDFLAGTVAGSSSPLSLHTFPSDPYTQFDFGFAC